MKMKLFSLFSGIGGLDWGLRDMVDLVGYSEIKKSSVEIYSRYCGNVVNYGDTTKIDFEDLPDFDILTGGFPCQSFSLAGLRKGFLDRKEAKGQMIFYVYNLLLVKKPKYVVLENVKGLINHNGGKTFIDVFKLLSAAGYFVRVLLLNSLYYGSAQNRERIFFLCSKSDFKVKVPKIINDMKRFRDIREVGGVFKFIDYSGRKKEKIEQKLGFNYELIGGYDRVGTLTTQYGCGEKAIWENGKYRCLTVLEAERLQGFPDGYTEGVSNSARYWALGNAVNCNMSNYLFKNYLKGLWW